MAEFSVVRFYTGLVLAEATVVVVVALWWRRTNRRVEGRPPRWTIGRLHPEPRPRLTLPEPTHDAPPQSGPSGQSRTVQILGVPRPEASSAARTAALASRVRALILKEVPVAFEVRYDTFSCPVLGFRLSESPHDGFCSVVTSGDCVYLVFTRGAELPDVEGLLRGSAAHSRYLALRTPDDLHTTGARRYLREALAELVQRRPPTAPHAVPHRPVPPPAA